MYEQAQTRSFFLQKSFKPKISNHNNKQQKEKNKRPACLAVYLLTSANEESTERKKT